MLIGQTVELHELKAQMNKQRTALKMKIRDLSKQLGDLNQKFKSLPKLKNEPLTQDVIDVVNQIRDVKDELSQAESDCDYLIRKLDEAELSKDAQQLVYLTLNDCLFYGIRKKQESEHE